jgi:hypothetical protein
MRDQVIESSIPNAVAAAGEIETLHFRTVCEESEQYFVARTAGILAAEPTKVWTCFCKADGGCVQHFVALVGVVAHVGELEFEFPESFGDAVAEKYDVVDVLAVMSSAKDLL